MKITYISTLFIMPMVSWLMFSDSSITSKPEWISQQTTEKNTGWANNGEQHLDIILRSDLPSIEQQLKASGWKSHQPKTWGNVYHAMRVDLDADDLPLFSYVHKGEVEQLLMSKEVGNHLIALRIWDNKNPLDADYRGSLTKHKRDNDLYIFNHWGYISDNEYKKVLFDDLVTGNFAVDNPQETQLRVIKIQK